MTMAIWPTVGPPSQQLELRRRRILGSATPAGDKRDGIHFARQVRTECHEYRLGGLGSVLGRVPAASDRVQHGLHLSAWPVAVDRRNVADRWRIRPSRDARVTVA